MRLVSAIDVMPDHYIQANARKDNCVLAKVLQGLGCLYR